MRYCRFILIPALFCLGACAVGRDFPRPDRDASLQLGQTTPAEVIAQYGRPRGGQEVKSVDLGQLPITPPSDQSTLTYSYASPMSHDERAAIFGFRDGRLATLLYISTFPDDQQRGLDRPTVEALFAGPPPTRATLVATLGPPQVRMLGPAGRPVEADAWYVFERRNLDRRVSSIRDVIAWMLTVRFSTDGLAVAHKFNVDDSP